MNETGLRPFRAEFQTFDDPPEAAAAAPRIAALREELARRGLDGFVVPHADRFQNEYLPPSEERLAWLTGFTGSAGAAVILADKAALFVDGRYTIQARNQVDGALFALEHLVDTPPSAWIETNLRAGQKLGYDPWLHSGESAERLGKACAAVGAMLVATTPNPVDAIWRDRPPPPHGAVVPHGLEYAGEAAAEKLGRIRAELAKLKADALVVSDPQGVAWTFNIRGCDVAHTPVALAFALVPAEGPARLYVEADRVTSAAKAALASLAEIRPPAAFEADVAALGVAHHTVQLDQASAACAIAQAITGHGGKAPRGADPIAAMKTIKNDTEIAGCRAAHRRDGAAMVRFLAWFERTAANGALTEIDAVEALETFRRDTGLLKEVSFPTISGSGPNGAIVHYRVTRRSNRTIAPGELYLVDSGAQYEDGTTDITRTVIVGEPTAEMRDRFTRVLKGHIAIARAVFPEGTTGAQLDSFARAPLWAAGLDFDHGTGHGVGSYLSVHEGPPRISKLGTTALKRGMILSNEPGYYKVGAYGIRIENLVLVIAAPAVPGADKPLNAFETLTLVPIDRRLIDTRLLDAGEIAWLDK
ncbi:MAG: aminopeptidase P family protein, partial [Xanthobacteraceae bacterium]|nr:aminopeptidase P family protein [Xanthobacteraceae bacterium]